MPVQRLREFLDNHGVEYVMIEHSLAYTAQEIAAPAHIPGQELAKAVIVKADNEMAMAVLPASGKVDFDRLKRATSANDVELADEQEPEGKFPGCEVGAIPPFGNLYGMDLFLDESLT